MPPEHIPVVRIQLRKRQPVVYRACCPYDWQGLAYDSQADAEREANAHRVLAAQSEYVRQWQAQNRVEVWGPPWRCPLCNRAVQDFFGLEAHAAQIEDHQQSHGADYRDYLALIDVS